MIGTRHITRRSFLAAAGLAAVGASLSLTGCSGSVSDGLSSKHLLVAHSHSEAHPVNVGLQKMTEVASAESDLTFSVYPNGQLGDNAAMIQLVKAGVLDIAKVSASSMEQFNSAYAIFSMPDVFESTEQYFAVMNQSEAVQEIFKSTYDQGFFAAFAGALPQDLRAGHDLPHHPDRAGSVPCAGEIMETGSPSQSKPDGFASSPKGGAKRWFRQSFYIL